MKTCEDMFGNLSGNRRNIDDLPSALRPAPGQAGATLGAGLQGVLHPVGGRHAPAGKAVRPGLPGAFLPGSPLAAGLGLDAGHPFGAAGSGLSLQDFDAPLQLGDDGLLLLNDSLQMGNQGQQVIPRHDAQVNVGIHASDLT